MSTDALKAVPPKVNYIWLRNASQVIKRDSWFYNNKAEAPASAEQKDGFLIWGVGSSKLETALEGFMAIICCLKV